MTKETRVYLLNISIALCIGLLLYLTTPQNTYIHTATESIFHRPFPTFRYDPVCMQLVRNWLGDFLWAYALCFALYRVLSPFRYTALLSTLGTVMLGSLLEFLQKAQMISGTFDYLDIIAETAAAILAMLIIKRSHTL